MAALPLINGPSLFWTGWRDQKLKFVHYDWCLKQTNNTSNRFSALKGIISPKKTRFTRMNDGELDIIEENNEIIELQMNIGERGAF